MKAVVGAAILGLALSHNIKQDISNAVHDAGSVASIVSTGAAIASHLFVEGENAEELVNIKQIGEDIGKVAKVAAPIAVGLLSEDEFKVNGQKILHDAGTAASIIGTGLKIADHFFVDGENAEELVNIKQIGEDIGKVAKVAAPIAVGLLSEDELKVTAKQVGSDIGGLFKGIASGFLGEDQFKVNGQKILNDAGDVAKVIGTGLSIADHLFVEGENAEELINIKKIGQDIGKVAKVAAPIAIGALAEDELKVTAKQVGSDIGGLFKGIASGFLGEDQFKVNKQKVLNDAGDVAKVIGTGLQIADHLYVEGENAEELVNIKQIGEDIGKVAKVAAPIAVGLLGEDEFKVNGQKILHDAGTAASIIGTGLKIADHFFVEGENAEELVNIKQIGEDIGKVAKVAAPIAVGLLSEDELKVTAKQVGSDIGGLFKGIASGFLGEDQFKVNGQKVLNDAGDVAKVIGTGLQIADHLFFNGENAEEKNFLGF